MKSQEAIELTEQTFIDFLMSVTPETVIGISRSAGSCPIARCVRDRLGDDPMLNITVALHRIAIWSRFNEEIPVADRITHAWEKRVQEFVDAKGWARTVTAGELINFLQSH